MKYSIIKLTHKLFPNASYNETSSQLDALLTNVPKICRFVIKSHYINNQLSYWQFECEVCTDNTYNTFKKEDCIHDTLIAITNDIQDGKYIILFKQPSLEMQIKMYMPYIKKLAQIQSQRWKTLEYDDIYSTCMLTCVRLYKRGYYLNKWLIKKSFENDILMLLRKHRNAPEILSLEQIMHSSDSDENVKLEDMLEDKRINVKIQDEEESQLIHMIFLKVKEIIVTDIGERRFDQLFRDYGNKHTTNWSRKQMQTIKQKFDKQGITKMTFINFMENKQ